MSNRAKWITPFMKQCFVSAGVVFNMAGSGVVMGYPSCLLPQLRQPDSYIDIDDSSGSWIVALVGVAVFPGNVITPLLMGKFGRRITNIISIIPLVIGWLIIASANSVMSLDIARVMHGFCIGMTTVLCPVSIGEYTSPKYRGMFLSTISLSISIGVVSVQVLGLYLSWHNTALVFASTAVLTLAIAIFSPESPSWLIDQGRYEDGKRAFRWLRELDEEDELKMMIAANIILKESKRNPTFQLTFKQINNKLSYFIKVIRKSEFYKPIIIMIHLYTLLYWGGIIPFTIYPVDLFQQVLGSEGNVSTMIVIIGILRLISNVVSVYAVKKFKRRTLLISTVGLNFCLLLVIAGYTYAKAHVMLPYDTPTIAITLLSIQMFVLVSGTQTLPYIIAGELFPLEYRSLASAISNLPTTPYFILVMKLVPYLFKSIGLHGAYCLFAGIVGYCLVVCCVMLPETKDRTLLDIENEFRGKTFIEDLKSAELIALDRD